jgi:hypothetical protein
MKWVARKTESRGLTHRFLNDLSLVRLVPAPVKVLASRRAKS